MVVTDIIFSNGQMTVRGRLDII